MIAINVVGILFASITFAMSVRHKDFLWTVLNAFLIGVNVHYLIINIAEKFR